MVRKIFRTGNSYCITLDKKMLRNLGMEGTIYVWIEPDKNKKQIIIRKREEKDW